MSNKNNKSQRSMCLRRTPEHFFAAVKPPYNPRSNAFKMLDSMAAGIHQLEEGSQVFVYEHEVFDYNGDPSDSFVEHIKEITQEVGRITLDEQLLPIEKHA
jgi:hypothetical protein